MVATPRLVIFDCDGVLVDSEVIANEVFADMLAELGMPLSIETLFDELVGRSSAQCREILRRLLPRPLPDDFYARYWTRATAALQARLRPVAGIETCLEALERRNVPYCVASSGTHEKMRTTLGLTGLLPRFTGRMFSVTEVANSKPAPDVFLLAASRNATPPAECAVVEDTPTGVAAGVAAGMTVYGYCAFTPERRLRDAGAHRTLTNMRTLPELLFESERSRGNA